MFNAPFSFDGRITRTEYAISFILYIVSYLIIVGIVESDPDNAILGLLIIPLLWFLWAQGAKRCHDVNNSGWMQIIPFYVLWMLFKAGHRGTNEYGGDPKGAEVYTPVASVPDQALSSITEATVGKAQSIPQDIPAQIPTQQVTILEVLNINYSLVQDVLRSLRRLELTNHLSYEFMDTTARITVNHKNTSQILLENLYTIMNNIEVLGVSEGSLKIKLM